jgi:hypothetical protein
VIDAGGKPVSDRDGGHRAGLRKIGTAGRLSNWRNGRKRTFQLAGHQFRRICGAGVRRTAAEPHRTLEFAAKYKEKGEKVSLDEGAKKSVTVKLIKEEGEK